MARDHARIKVAIWRDQDFLALKVAEQHCFMSLLSNGGLSRVGVVDYVPARFVRLAADQSEPKFRRAVKALRDSRFVLVDERTQELLIRSYVRLDGVFDRVNMGKAVGTAFESVVSTSLTQAIGHELARHMKEYPDLPGWEGLAATSPTAYEMATGFESRIQ